jgi:hypothetical protein
MVAMMQHARAFVACDTDDQPALEEIALPSPASLGKGKGRWGCASRASLPGFGKRPHPPLETHTQVHTLMQVAPGVVVKLVTI